MGKLTDGQKAQVMRTAISRSLAQLPDTAHDPRHVLRLAFDLPAMVLAILFDEIKGGV